MLDAHALFQERGWIEDPRAYHLDPPPMVAPSVVSGRLRGLAYEHVSFESGYEPPAGVPGRESWMAHEANRTGHAWLVRHRGEPRPWLVCVIAGIPASDLLALYRHHAPPRLRRRALEHHVFGEEAHAVHRVISPLTMPARVPRDRRFVYAGLGDRMSTPHQAHRLWEH